MEDLKLLIEMVANLPALAVWVLAGYLAYKVAIVGSIYGTIRLFIVKVHDWLIRPKVFKIGASLINEDVVETLNVEISRLCRGSKYIHMSDVITLREALDAKIGK